MKTMNDKKYDTDKFVITHKGTPLNPVDEKDMIMAHLRNDDIECCGCGESDHKKLENITFEMPYKKVTLKPKTFICGDCVKKLEFNKP